VAFQAPQISLDRHLAALTLKFFAVLEGTRKWQTRLWVEEVWGVFHRVGVAGWGVLDTLCWC